jgi:hypothetical protein
MVTVPAAGSTALTKPPTPRFCQSCKSCWCLASRSERFITTIFKTGKRLVIVRNGPAGGPDVVPNLQILQLDGRGIVHIRFAGSKAHDLRCGLNGNFDLGPVSGVNVISVPSMALIAPMRFATARGAAFSWALDSAAGHNRKAHQRLVALAAQSAIHRRLGCCVHTPPINLHAAPHKTVRFTKFYFCFREYESWLSTETVILRSAGSPQTAIARRSIAPRSGSLQCSP